MINKINKTILKIIDSPSMLLLLGGSIVFIPVLLLGLGHLFIFLRLQNIFITDFANWLQFFGGYFGVILSYAGIFIVIRWQSKADKKMNTQNWFEQKEIEYIYTIRDEISKIHYTSGEIIRSLNHKSYYKSKFLNIDSFEESFHEYKLLIDKLTYTSTSLGMALDTETLTLLEEKVEHIRLKQKGQNNIFWEKDIGLKGICRYRENILNSWETSGISSDNGKFRTYIEIIGRHPMKDHDDYNEVIELGQKIKVEQQKITEGAKEIDKLINEIVVVLNQVIEKKKKKLLKELV